MECETYCCHSNQCSDNLNCISGIKETNDYCDRDLECKSDCCGPLNLCHPYTCTSHYEGSFFIVLICWVIGVTIGIFSLGFLLNICYKILCNDYSDDDSDLELDKYFEDGASFYSMSSFNSNQIPLISDHEDEQIFRNQSGLKLDKMTKNAKIIRNEYKVERSYKSDDEARQQLNGNKNQQFSFQNTINLKSMETFRNQMSSNMNSQRTEDLSQRKGSQAQFKLQQEYYLTQVSQGNFPVSPNLFLNPLNSGLNSVKNASPMMNNTANFAGIGLKGTVSHQSFRDLQNINSSSCLPIDNELLQPRNLGYFYENQFRDGQENQLKEKLQVLKQAQQQVDKTVNSLSDLQITKDLNSPKLTDQHPLTSNFATFGPGTCVVDQTRAGKIDDRLYQDFRQKQRRIEDLQYAQYLSQQSQLQKAPVISPRSQKLAQQSGLTFQQKQQQFMRNKLQRETENIRIKSEQQQMVMRKTPDINYQSQQMERNLHDLMIWKQKKDKYQQELKKNIEAQQDFTINMHRNKNIVTVGSQKYLTNRPHIPVEQRLIMHGQIRDEKLSLLRLQKEQEQQLQMSPRVNRSSSRGNSSRKNLSPKSPNSVFNRLYNQYKKPISPSTVSSPPRIKVEDVEQVSTNKFQQMRSASCKNYLNSFQNQFSQKPPQQKLSSKKQSQKNFHENEIALTTHFQSQKMPSYTSLFEKVNQVGQQYSQQTDTQNSLSPDKAKSIYEAILAGKDDCFKPFPYTSHAQQPSSFKSSLKKGSLTSGSMKLFDKQNNMSSTLHFTSHSQESNFSPPSKKKKRSKSSRGMRWKDLGVIERNEIFLNNKNKKIESARAQQIGKEVEGCTFEPKLNNSYKPPRYTQSMKRLPNNQSFTHVGSKKSLGSEKGDQGSYSTIYEKRQSIRSKSNGQNSQNQSLNNSKTSDQTSKILQISQKDRTLKDSSQAATDIEIRNMLSNTGEDLIKQLEESDQKRSREEINRGYFTTYKQILDTLQQNYSGQSTEQIRQNDEQEEEEEEKVEEGKQEQINIESIRKERIKMNKSLETIEEENINSAEYSRFNMRTDSVQTQNSQKDLERQKQEEVNDYYKLGMTQQQYYQPLCQRVAKYTSSYNKENSQIQEKLELKAEVKEVKQVVGEDTTMPLSDLSQNNQTISAQFDNSGYCQNLNKRDLMLAEEMLNLDQCHKVGVSNADKFREKLNKAKATLARIREANK